MELKTQKAELTFMGVTVSSANRVYVIAQMDDFLDEQPNHSYVLKWSDRQWAQIPVSEIVIGVCFLDGKEPSLVNVCCTGDVKVGSATGVVYETVDDTDDGPNQSATLRTARIIGGKVHTAGMARRVYRRTEPGKWIAIDDGTFLSREKRTSAIGFLGLDGFGLKDIYAVGYRGEIWHYDGNKWTIQESPTNVTLTSVRCASNGIVYITGMAGIIIRGTAGRWESFEHNVTNDDFWDIAIFNGTPYFSTNKTVYSISNESLIPVVFGVRGDLTARHLDCDSDVLWSVGSKHLFSTRDGSSWDAISGPS